MNQTDKHLLNTCAPSTVWGMRLQQWANKHTESLLPESRQWTGYLWILNHLNHSILCQSVLSSLCPVAQFTEKRTSGRQLTSINGQAPPSQGLCSLCSRMPKGWQTCSPFVTHGLGSSALSNNEVSDSGISLINADFLPSSLLVHIQNMQFLILYTDQLIPSHLWPSIYCFQCQQDEVTRFL